MGRKKPDFSGGMRRCPALSSRDIPVERCENFRGVRIRCGQHCEYNLFGLMNFDKFPALERRVLRALVEHYLDDPVNPVDIRQALILIQHRKRALEVLSPRGLPYWYHLWLERDGNGESQVDRWQAGGFKGLDADLRAFLHNAGRSMQIGLIEVEDHLRAGLFKIRRLLNPDRGLSHFHAPELDHKLPRYQPYLCRVYTTPYAWRMAGPPYMKWPDFGLRDAKESFLEIVAHLGGPLKWDDWSAFELTEWLVHNFDRFTAVVADTVAERRRLAKLGRRRRPSRVDFNLPAGRSVDIGAIDNPPFPLRKAEAVKLPAGYINCWEVHESPADDEQQGVVAMDGLRSGLLYSGKGRVRFETVDHERFQELKGNIAGILGPDASITSEYEDPAVKELLAHHSKMDPPLPLGLLRGFGEPSSLLIQSPPPAPARDGPFTVRRAAAKWIDEPQDVLEGLTPLQALSGFTFRAELLQAARIWVRKLDEECLLRGRRRDDYQFLRGLGLDRDLLNDRRIAVQLISRARLVHRNRLRPLPIEAVRNGPMAREATMDRLALVMEWFERNQVFDFLQPVRPIFECMVKISIMKRFSDMGRMIFQRNLAFCWYALAGKAYWTPIEFRPTLLLANARKYSETFYKFYEKQVDVPWELASPEWADDCSQPNLAHVSMSLMGHDFYEADLIPNDGEVDDVVELIGLQTAFIDEFDSALHNSTDADSVKPFYATKSWERTGLLL